MDKVFGWIGEIFQTLLRFIPWLVIVRATHRGVAFSHGKYIKVWEPGLQWYWPLVTQYVLYTVVRQTQLIQPKVVMTADLQSVLVGALITYHVDDIVAALTTVADLPSDVIERTLPLLLGLVSRMTLAEIQADRQGFNDKITEDVRKVLSSYGVSVHAVQLTELCPCRCLAISAHAAVGQYSLWATF